MKYYYIINGKIMSANEKMPIENDYGWNHLYQEDKLKWNLTLQPCEISESELEKLKNKLVSCGYVLSLDTIEVTDIVELEWNKKYAVYELFFKQPKQVEEIEAVEFVEWILDNTAGVLGTKQRNYYVKGLLHGKYTTKQLYEIFKNQK